MIIDCMELLMLIPSLYDIKGKVFFKQKKCAFVQHWWSQKRHGHRKISSKNVDDVSNGDIYSCITCVIAHYDDSCARFCVHYKFMTKDF